MQHPTKLILLITLILLPLDVIGVNTQKYSSLAPIEQHVSVLLNRNVISNITKKANEGIQGFDCVPGHIYRLKVRLEERPEGIQDVGRYEYHLIEVLRKEEASIDERPPRKP